LQIDASWLAGERLDPVVRARDGAGLCESGSTRSVERVDVLATVLVIVLIFLALLRRFGSRQRRDRIRVVAGVGEELAHLLLGVARRVTLERIELAQAAVETGCGNAARTA
jgi:hypothetical protein